MQSMMPGVVSIPHGAWVNVDEETGIDRSGADNYLLGNEMSGSGVTRLQQHQLQDREVRRSRSGRGLP